MTYFPFSLVSVIPQPPLHTIKLQQYWQKCLSEQSTVKESWPYLRCLSSVRWPYKRVANNFSWSEAQKLKIDLDQYHFTLTYVLLLMTAELPEREENVVTSSKLMWIPSHQPPSIIRKGSPFACLFPVLSHLQQREQEAGFQCSLDRVSKQLWINRKQGCGGLSARQEALL